MELLHFLVTSSLTSAVKKHCLPLHSILEVLSHKFQICLAVLKQIPFLERKQDYDLDL